MVGLPCGDNRAEIGQEQSLVTASHFAPKRPPKAVAWQCGQCEAGGRSAFCRACPPFLRKPVATRRMS